MSNYTSSPRFKRILVQDSTFLICCLFLGLGILIGMLSSAFITTNPISAVMWFVVGADISAFGAYLAQRRYNQLAFNEDQPRHNRTFRHAAR